MIKAIAFDLWETLITEDAATARQQERLRLDRIEKILGHPPVRIESAYRQIWQRCHELYWSDDRDISCRRQIEHFIEALEMDPSSVDEATLAEIEHAYANAALEILPRAVTGAPETLDHLKQRDLVIGLISNTGRTPGYILRQILDRLGLARSIDVMVFSNEHGECKPRASIFEQLRNGLGVPYEETMFVGDNLYVDVYGSQRCGMRGVHFVPPERGTAVAPPFEHDMEIHPFATINALGELPGIIERMMDA
jgi:putative hydrolase of the HAD superfamily